MISKNSSRYKIKKGLFIIDKALYIEDHNTLIMADFHIGFEEKMRSLGTLMPKQQVKDIERDVKYIIKAIGKKLKRIIICGDFKHNFGTINKDEWKGSMKILELLDNNSKKVIFIKGNHDSILFPILKKKGIELVDQIMVGDHHFIHGDKAQKIPKSAKTIIIGHVHPAITIRSSIRSEKYKCFLVGEYKESRKKYGLIVLPSFNPMMYGTDIIMEEIKCPYIDDRSDFEVFVVEDKIYPFGKVKDMKR